MSSPAIGRPRLHDDAEILSAALVAFSRDGFEGTSVRGLARELGLSHGALNERFGSKERLFYAAVDHGFGSLLADLDSDVGDQDPLAALHEQLETFLIASIERPEIARLMHREGLEASPRLDHIWRTYIEPQVVALAELLAGLAADGRVRPIPVRSVFFLLAHGAAAPYTLAGLSTAFDDHDGPFDGRTHATAMADLLITGIRIGD